LPLARKLAGRYLHAGEPYDDLVQVACVGLIKAVDRYEPARGRGFVKYAVPTMLGELKRHFRDKGWSVRVPRATQELALKVSEAMDELPAKSGLRLAPPEPPRQLHRHREREARPRNALRSTGCGSMARGVGGMARPPA
jgi:RNA polymerase sigma-B factor